MAADSIRSASFRRILRPSAELRYLETVLDIDESKDLDKDCECWQANSSAASADCIASQAPLISKVSAAELIASSLGNAIRTSRHLDVPLKAPPSGRQVAKRMSTSTFTSQLRQDHRAAERDRKSEEQRYAMVQHDTRAWRRLFDSFSGSIAPLSACDQPLSFDADPPARKHA